MELTHSRARCSPHRPSIGAATAQATRQASKALLPAHVPRSLPSQTRVPRLLCDAQRRSKLSLTARRSVSRGLWQRLGERLLFSKKPRCSMLPLSASRCRLRAARTQTHQHAACTTKKYYKSGSPPSITTPPTAPQRSSTQQTACCSRERQGQATCPPLLRSPTSFCASSISAPPQKKTQVPTQNGARYAHGRVCGHRGPVRGFHGGRPE